MSPHKTPRPQDPKKAGGEELLHFVPSVLGAYFTSSRELKEAGVSKRPSPSVPSGMAMDPTAANAISLEHPLYASC